VVEGPPSKYEALNSKPSSAKKKRKEEIEKLLHSKGNKKETA
jgi:hypothetical protein